MSRNQTVSALIEHIGGFILNHRILMVLLVLVLGLVSGYGIQWVRFDSSNESFLPDGDELSIANSVFKDIFGNEEFVFILVESDRLFSQDVLEKIQSLRDDLDAELPFVREVSAITSIDHMDTVDGDLVISPLIPEEIPGDEASLEAIRKKLSSSKMYMGKLITEDWRYTGISITFEHIPDEVWVEHPEVFTPVSQMNWADEDVIMMDRIYYSREESDQPEKLVKIVDARKLIAPALKVILKRHLESGLNVRATGIPVMDFEGDRLIGEEGSRLGLIALLAAMALLLVLFRSPASIVAPFLVILLTVVSLFGVMGWFDIPLSMMSIIVAPLLIVISVSYSIHYINHFNFKFRQGASRGESLIYAYQQATWPCFLTALTTSVGFGSFLIVPMTPIRDIGLASASGVLLAYIFVMIIVPISYSIGVDKSRKIGRSGQSDRGSYTRRMEKLAKWVSNHRRLISIVSIVCCGFFILQVPRVKVETDFFSLIGKGIPYIDEALSITDILGGQYSYELMIELPDPEMGKEPDVLMAVDQIAAAARKWSNVSNSMSLVDLVKEINYVMNDQNDQFYSIPDTREMIAQYLLLYEISGGDTLSDWIDTGYQKLRISVQLVNTDDLEEQVVAVRILAEKLLPAGTKITALGDVPVMIRLMSLLTAGQIQSILIAFMVIGLIMMIILKSVKTGAISLIPNAFPVLVVVGTMGLLKINLDMVTVMIAPMIIGIAVDDTVHFFIHFKEEYFGTGSYDNANIDTFRKIGNALLFTSIVLTSGFIIFGFSRMLAIVNLGVLAAVGIVAALVADFFIAPVLLTTLKPFGKADHSKNKETARV